MDEKELSLTRKVSFFEGMLLFAGFAVVFVGFYLIHKQFLLDNGQLSWYLLTCVFLWLLLIIGIILVALVEDVKVSLTDLLTQHLEEVRLLKEEDTLLGKLTKAKSVRKKR